MKLRLVPALQGWRWVQRGLLTAKAQPVAFLALVGLLVSSMLLLAVVPVLGALLVLGLMPAVWMSFMLATHMANDGQRVTPAVLLEPWRMPGAPKQEWIKLGAAYMAAMILAMQLADWFGPGNEALQLAHEQSKDLAELAENPTFQADILWRWGLTLPVSLLFWHTPALVLWGRIPVGKAIFFSAVASWRNLSAFAIYGLSWGAVALLVALLVRALATLIPVPMVVEVLVVMISMWTASAFYASLYFTVVDCFEAPHTKQADAAADQESSTSPSEPPNE